MRSSIALLPVLTLLLWSLLPNALTAQKTTMTGQVSDADTGEPLIGLMLLLENTRDTIGVISDEKGNYYFSDVEPGRYNLSLSYVGYYPLRIDGYLVGSGPVSGRDFALERNPSLALPNVVVRSSLLPTNPLSREITLEQVRRLPATFYDPARLLALTPGVVQANDQANHLSVRGNSPNRNMWRVQGLAIVNPNHTANAGTISDAPAFSGGGVNALSAQLLDNSTFYAGGVPTEFGYASGGTFDMQLRPGNNQQRQYQVQAGLIGIDLATEGPIGKGPFAASYLINYRYSFTGLLGDAGVDFGGEEIRFQDLNLHLYQPLKNGGGITAFSIWGNSKNEFTGPATLEEISEEKELFNIDFAGDLFVAGLKYEQTVGRGRLAIGGAYSTLGNDRSQVSGGYLQNLQDFRKDQLLEMNRTSVNANYTYNLELRSQLKIGTEILQENASTQTITTATEENRLMEYDINLVSPYVSISHRTNYWRYTAGLRYTLASAFSNNGVLEPRLAISHFTGRNTYTVNLEANSRVPMLGLLTENYLREFGELPVTYQANLAWRHTLKNRSSIQLAAYYQQTPNDFTIGSAETTGGQPANSVLALPYLAFYEEETESRSYGLEIALDRPIEGENWYYSLNATVFNAAYRGLDGEWSPGRYDQSFAFRALIGKEWAGEDRKERRRTFGFNLALLANGGERQPMLNIEASRNRGFFNDVYTTQDGFTAQNGAYFRPDLRLYKRKFRKKTTTTLALDIQNVAGISNVAYQYYDDFLEDTVERQQLGLIPVLSYRIEWR